MTIRVVVKELYPHIIHLLATSVNYIVFTQVAQNLVEIILF